MRLPYIIPQPWHAGHAAELGALWKLPPQVEPYRQELLEATRRHDDGWSEWEDQCQAGVPPQFWELPLNEHLDIWRRTLKLAEARSRTVAYLVGYHAFKLYRNRPEAAQFCEEIASLQNDWVADPSPGLMDAGELLQTWDALSLAICLQSEREQTREIPGISGSIELHYHWFGGALVYRGTKLPLRTLEVRTLLWPDRAEGPPHSCILAPQHLVTELEETIVELVEQRGPKKTICPSEAPRVMGLENWRDCMELTRGVARKLAHEGRLEFLQKGQPIDPDDFRGPIRLRILE